MDLLESLGFFTNIFYEFGMNIWNFMVALITINAAYTPQAFSTLTWRYLTYELWPLMSGLGASMLNLSFFIGYIRQASNLKQDYTVEIFVESGIKVVVGNYFLLNGLNIMKLMFEMAALLCGNILIETTVTFEQTNNDTGSAMFYFLFGLIFFVVCLVCAGMIFLTIYGRYLNLYMLVATMPIAIGTLPGGGGMSQAAFAWIRTFLAKTFEIVLIVIAVVLASKMCNGIDFGSFDGEVTGVFDGAIQALQNMVTMVLLTATVKGMDVFMRRTFGL